MRVCVASLQIGLLVQATLPEKRLNLIILFHSTCNTRQVHEHSFNCFSCQLSLQKRQETQFPHTEWGTWVQDVSFIQCHMSQFFFSCQTVQQFFPPSHPLASYCLEFSSRQCSNVWVVFFACCWLQFCDQCDVDRSVNKVLLHCHMVDKMHSACEKCNWFILEWPFQKQ